MEIVVSEFNRYEDKNVLQKVFNTYLIDRFAPGSFIMSIDVWVDDDT